MSDFHPGVPEHYRNEVVTGDARLLAEALPDESVDLIFTDPPYPREFLHLYGDLAEMAARVLKPGGSVFALAGHYYLPEIIAALQRSLDYHWLCAVYQPTVTHSYRCFPKRLDVYWKPLLWFTKGRYTGPFLMDGVNSSAPDKRFHEWGQDARWARQFLERLCGVVLDPFTGGGTVPAVCKQLGRNFIAFEIDPATAERARERVRLTPLPLLLPEPEPHPSLFAEVPGC
jgi:tRNA1(Val) A37 N6-methylase TrmN6